MWMRKRNFKIIAFLITVSLLFDSGMIVCADGVDPVQAVSDRQEGEREIDNLQQDDIDEGKPGTNPGENLETDPKDESEADPKDEPETDPKDEPETDPKDESETDPKDESETDPRDESETDPEEDPEVNFEEESEENSKEGPVEIGNTDEEGLTKSASAEEAALLSVTTLAMPENLKLDNAHPYIKTLTWDAVDGAEGYEIFYAVDSGLAGGSLSTDAYNRLGYTVENSYECNLAENEELNPGGEFNHYPVETQYYSYRVRAVCQGEKEKIESSFSKPVCSNGMYADSLQYINKKRTEYHLPGTGDYVRFYLGNADGAEYNEANPIQLHQGEGIDGLAMWAVCEDGSRVSYCDIRDAIAAYEKSHEKTAGMYKEESDAVRYGFTWCIADRLSTVENVFNTGADHISSYVKYAGNTVPDQLGFKAEQITAGRMYLAVALNNSLLPDYGSVIFDQKNAMCFEFFVPVIIEAAEAGSEYDDLDQSDVICSSGEELWRIARQKIHDREEEFVLLLDADAYNAFLDAHGYRRYTEWNDSVFEDYVSLADDKIVDTWLFTKYAEQDWMEPWAGDNLQDCISNCLYGDVQPCVNGTYYYGIQWSAKYYTTADQEQELNTEISKLLGEGGVLHDAYISDEPLKKIQAAYDYTRGIQWVDGTRNPLNYTVYSGVVLRKGSCESSSLTFVRLCREMGIQARVVKDDHWGGAGNHAWNIVEYKGLWYYVDCTSGKFLKGSSAYNPSKQLPIYSEKEFTDSHPLSKSDYALKKVTYYLNGGTIASDSPGFYEPGDILTFTVPLRAGYTFEGWFADKGFRTQITGPEGGSYDTSSLTGSLTLYAKWKVNEYVLSYELNVPEGAVIKLEVPLVGMVVKYDSPVKIAVNKTVVYKYKFAGWNTEADGSGTSYKAGVSAKNLSSGGECILYAQWAPATYTVKYDSNASSLGLPAKGKVANKIMTFDSASNTTSENAFKIDGYRFIGWNTRADGRGLSLAGQEEPDGTVSGLAVIGTALETVYAVDAGAVVVLYAQWEAVPYTVRLYKNDGSVENEPAQSISVNIGEVLSARNEISEIKREGYRLASWNTRADGKGKKYALTARNLAKSGEEISLYAQWSKPVSYKITYDLQGGRNAAKNPRNYTVASTDEQRTLLNPVRTGYTFVKWVDAAAADADNAPGIAVIPAETCCNITLRAVWSENSYQVTYHGTDEKYTNVTEPVTETYKYTELVDTFKPARKFTLKGEVENKISISAWTTKPNGKGKSYAVGRGFSKLSADNFDAENGRGNIDLYARWSTAVYRITYQNCDTRDGVRNSNAASYVYNAKKAVSIKAPARTGYVFTGWTVSDGNFFDQTKNQIKAGAAEDIVLTANWMPVTYTVKLNLNVKDKGVSFKEGKQTVYGDTKYNIEEPSFVVQDIVNIPDYYELTGWNTKPDGKGIMAKCIEDENENATSVNLAGLNTKNKGTVTLYAIWKSKDYTITYKNVDPDTGTEKIVELTGVKMRSPVTYAYSVSKAMNLKKPAKYGFIFEGWYRGYDIKTGEFTDKVTSIPKGSYGDITLYGKWKVK